MGSCSGTHVSITSTRITTSWEKTSNPVFQSGVLVLKCFLYLRVKVFRCHKISTFLKRQAVVFGEELANTMGNILAATKAVVNDEADISAFIDLSVLIRLSL